MKRDRVRPADVGELQLLPTAVFDPADPSARFTVGLVDSFGAIHEISFSQN